MGTVKKIVKSEVVGKAVEKKAEEAKIVKHQKTVTAADVKAMETVTKKEMKAAQTAKAEKKPKAAKNRERNVYIHSLLLQRKFTDAKIKEISDAKFPNNIILSGGGGVSGVRWDINNGNLGFEKPAEPIIRMVEVEGKIVTYTEKKATKKAARIAKKDPAILGKYDLKKQSGETEKKVEETKIIKKVPVKK